jgi:hypothetical protein
VNLLALQAKHSRRKLNRRDFFAIPQLTEKKILAKMAF